MGERRELLVRQQLAGERREQLAGQQLAEKRQGTDIGRMPETVGRATVGWEMPGAVVRRTPGTVGGGDSWQGNARGCHGENAGNGRRGGQPVWKTPAAVTARGVTVGGETPCAVGGKLPGMVGGGTETPVAVCLGECRERSAGRKLAGRTPGAGGEKTAVVCMLRVSGAELGQSVGVWWVKDV